MADNSTTNEQEKDALSMTLPSVIYRALASKAALFGMKPQEWLKQQVLASAFGADIVLRLKPEVDAILAESARTKPGAENANPVAQELPFGS